MSVHFKLFSLAACFFINSCSGCTAQHDPRGDWAAFEQERITANRDLPKLTKEGTLPSTDGAVTQELVQEKYATLCSTCHGAQGKGDGVAGAALNPKPRSFVDTAWQNQTADEQIAKVIKDGGPAAGLSPLMAPWGAVLGAAEIQGMVVYIRSLKP
jgi:mono/diheme cytochrome c family protein